MWDPCHADAQTVGASLRRSTTSALIAERICGVKLWRTQLQDAEDVISAELTTRERADMGRNIHEICYKLPQLRSEYERTER